MEKKTPKTKPVAEANEEVVSKPVKAKAPKKVKVEEPVEALEQAIEDAPISPEE